MIKMDLGDRLIKLANKLLSAGSSETLGTQGGITNETANDVLVPTSKAVKDYVDGKTIELITTTNTSDEELAATSTTLSEVKDGTMILLKVINPFTRISADCALTLTLKNGGVFGGKLINHPDSPTGILHSNIVPPNTIFLMRYNGLRWDIIDQYNLATQSFRGFMSAEDKTKLDNTYAKTEIDALNASKVDKVTGKGLSTNDFTNDYKYDLEDLTSYKYNPVYMYDNQTVVYDPDNPWEYQQIGKVVHIAGKFICLASGVGNRKVAYGLPKPFKEVIAVQQGTGKNTYTLKIDEAGDMYIYNYGTNSVSEFPVNVALPIHVTYLMEW